MGNKNRGWQVDRLLQIGHLEASLSHLDEFPVLSADGIELRDMIYQSRKKAMEDLFEEAKDQNMWCVIKHLATAYVMSSEICHARNGESADIMTATGDCLALATEMALDIERTSCLRCLSERMAK